MLVVLVVTTSVTTVEGAIQAGIGFFVTEQILSTVLPARIGASSLTVVLFAFGALDVRISTPKECSSSRSAARRRGSSDCSSLGRPTPRSSRHAQHLGHRGQWLTPSRSSSCAACASPSAGSRPCHSITFDVAAGESVGLVGPNGAGKTTLFNCVCGQLRPDRATSSSTGRRWPGCRPTSGPASGIGRTYQRVEVFTDMSVRDHLMVAERARRGEGRLWRDLLNMSKPTPEEMERVEAILELVGHRAPGRHVGQRARPGTLPPGRAGPGAGRRAEDPAGRRAVLGARPARDGGGGGGPAHGAARAGHGRAPGRARPLHGGRGGRPHRRHGPRRHAGARAPSTRSWPNPPVRDAYLGQMGIARDAPPRSRRRRGADVLSVRHVSAAYGPYRALFDVSFRVPDGRRRGPGRLERRRQVHRGPHGHRTGDGDRRARSSSPGRTSPRSRPTRSPGSAWPTSSRGEACSRA